MYFNEAGQIEYDTRIVTNITKRTNIIKNVMNNPDLYFKYVLNSGDTPESLAYDFYKDVNLHWIIFLVNEIYDPLYQWYLTYNEVIAYTKLKYGDPEFQETQYWLWEEVKYKTKPDITEDPNGLAESVTNLDVEVKANDDRQTIKILYPEYKNQVIREYKRLI